MTICYFDNPVTKEVERWDLEPNTFNEAQLSKDGACWSVEEPALGKRVVRDMMLGEEQRKRATGEPHVPAAVD